MFYFVPWKRKRDGYSCWIALIGRLHVLFLNKSLVLFVSCFYFRTLIHGFTNTVRLGSSLLQKANPITYDEPNLEALKIKFCSSELKMKKTRQENLFKTYTFQFIPLFNVQIHTTNTWTHMLLENIYYRHTEGKDHYLIYSVDTFTALLLHEFHTK